MDVENIQRIFFFPFCFSLHLYYSVDGSIRSKIPDRHHAMVRICVCVCVCCLAVVVVVFVVFFFLT